MSLLSEKLINVYRNGLTFLVWGTTVVGILVLRKGLSPRASERLLRFSFVASERLLRFSFVASERLVSCFRKASSDG